MTIEIVVPVYNEEDCLAKNVLYLQNYLQNEVFFEWKITIADNASTDKTPEIGKDLSEKHKKVFYKSICKKGRGYALRETFLKSESDILCYMDVDLSTNLMHLKALINHIANGFDLAVGSRLAKGAKITRRPMREFFSRIYNFLIKILFLNRFSDAQCGFKAIKTSVAKKLVPLVKNNNWFFDTEIMLLAEYNGFKIYEEPIEWIEDLTTKVIIMSTAWEDIIGLMRVRLNIHKTKIDGNGK